MCEASDEDGSTFRNVAYLIGDKNSFIFRSLVGSAGTSSTGVEGSWNGELTLDTKYYSCSLTLRSFPTVDKAREWSVRKSEEIGAVIYQFSDACSLPDVKKALESWNIDTQMIICEQLEHRTAWTEEIKKFCVVQGIELIELDPAQETLDELAEYRETYGVPRILQVLETTDWMQRVLKDPRRQAGNSGGVRGRECNAEKRCPIGLSKEQSEKGSSLAEDFGLGNASFINEDNDFGEFQSGFGDANHNSESALNRKGEIGIGESSHAKADPSTCGKPKKTESAKDVAEKLKEDIDKLAENSSGVDDVLKKFVEARSQLSQMSFGPDRQNLAADTMMQMIQMLGEDLLNDSSDEDA